MAKDKEKEEKETKKKHGPIFKLIRFIILLFFLILFIAIGLVIYLGINIVSSDNFTGNETVERIKSEDKSFNTVKNDILYDSFTTLSDSDTTYSISLDEEEMNYLLHSVSKDISKNVDNVYIIYGEDNYSLYMPVEWLFFKSCLVMDTKITYSSSTDTIDLNITNLSLGKFGVSNFFVKTFVLPNLNAKYIDNLFAKVNLTTTTNFDNGNINISINSDDFINLILSNTSNDLYSVLYSTLKTNSKVSYSFTKDSMSINFDLTDAKETGNKYSLETSLNSVKNNMNTLLENKIVNEDNSNLVFNYLVNGYRYLSDDEKQEIKKIDLSSISISEDNVESYTGIIERNSGLISAKFVIADLKNLSPSVVVSDDDLNKELNNQDVVGKSFVFLNMDSSKFTYIIIESLYTEISADHVSVNILININSFETLIKLDFACVNGIGKLELSLENSSIGSIAVDNSNSTTIMKYIESVVTTKMMYVNENNNFVIDLSVYESEKFKGALELLGFHSEYELEEDQIKISYKI